MSAVEVPGNGSAVTVSVGDEVVVRLPEKGTTGYQWSPDELPPGVEVVSNELDLEGKTAPGAAAQRVVVLQAVRPGSAQVRLVLARAWETGPPADEFVFVVHVR